MDDLSKPIPYSALARLSVLTALAIVYESFIPFEYRSVPFDQAITNFENLRWEPLGVGGRGDWLGDVVLYVPLGFLLCGALSRRGLVEAIALAALPGIVLAIGVEFAQTWASPRTVRLNDIVAEVAGTLVGIGFWSLLGRRLTRAAQASLQGGSQGVRAALGLYLIAYAFVTLFPFDFLFRASEIHERLQGPGAIVAVPSELLTPRGAATLALKVALMFPLGIALRFGWRRGPTFAAAAGSLISLIIELAHWFEFSAQSDAANIVAAASGAALGNVFATSMHANERSVAQVLRSSVWLVALVYVAALPLLWGWHASLTSRGLAWDTLANLNWTPFYYHYYSSKVRALVSLLAAAASFAPVGALFWAARFRDWRSAGESITLMPTVLAAGALSAVIETGALITAGLRPDPTNVLIAMAAAVIAQRGCEWLARVVCNAPSAESPPA